MSNEQFHTAFHVKQLRICLPKLELSNYPLADSHIPCFGCSQYFGNEIECAEHIFRDCLRIKSWKTDENIRPEVVKWITDYFRYSSLKKGSVNDLEIIKDLCCKNVVQERRTNLRVMLNPISKNLRCPVCEGYFCSSEATCKHLFKVCLFTENFQTAVGIKKWLSQYFGDISKKKDEIQKLNLQVDNFSVAGEGIICKYCKINLPDKEQLMDHFATRHLHVNDALYPLCFLCNFKAVSKDKLIRHIFAKHVRCGCGLKLYNYITMKEHFRMCCKNQDAVCPICEETKIVLFDSEVEFCKHLIDCKKSCSVNIRIDDLLFECDICLEKVLKSDADDHLAYHFKLDNYRDIQSKRIFVNLSDLRDVLSDIEFKKLQTAINGQSSINPEVIVLD